MAESGERRMLFDIRGRRRHVIRVVYAVLALLMGASLFLVVGPVNIGELIGSSGTSSANEALEDQAERIEGRLRRDPEDEALLLSLTRTRIAAGNSFSEVNPQTGESFVTPEGQLQLEQAADAWDRYLGLAKEPSASAAPLAAAAFFSLAQVSTTFDEAMTNLAEAARAQDIAATARPSVGSLTSLAYYEYLTGDFASGDKASEQAKSRASSKEEAKAIETQLGEFRKQGKGIQKPLKEAEKAQQGSGKEALQNPFGGLAGAGSSPGGP